MDEYISKLKLINKSELSEKDFFEKVLNVIKDMENVKLNYEDFEQLKNALKEIGCVTYDEWKNYKERNGEKIKNYKIGEAIELGDISGAEKFINQLLGSYETAKFSLPFMLEGGKELRWSSKMVGK